MWALPFRYPILVYPVQPSKGPYDAALEEFPYQKNSLTRRIPLPEEFPHHKKSGTRRSSAPERWVPTNHQVLTLSGALQIFGCSTNRRVLQKPSAVLETIGSSRNHRLRPRLSGAPVRGWKVSGPWCARQERGLNKEIMCRYTIIVTDSAWDSRDLISYIKVRREPPESLIT